MAYLLAGWYLDDDGRVPDGYVGCWGVTTKNIATAFPQSWLVGSRLGSHLVLNGSLYGFAGQIIPDGGGAGTLTTAAWRYDIDTGTWHELADYPLAVTFIGSAVHGGSVYTMGGADFGLPTRTAHVYKYNPDTDTYTRMADLPSPADLGNAVTIGDAIYYLGHYSDAHATSTVVWRYDIGSNAWSTVASMPAARLTVGAVAHDGRLYAAGGRTGPDGTLPGNTNFWAYDPDADAWEALADYPTPTYGVYLFSFGGKIHGVSGQYATTKHYEYDPDTDTWTALADIPGGLGGMSGVHEGTMILVGRYFSAAYLPTDQMEPYPATVGFTRAGCNPPPGPVVIGSPTDRYRASIAADSRSLLSSTASVPFDTSVSINVPPAAGLLPQQTLYPLREATRDATGSVYDVLFYPRAAQNAAQQRQYDGITLLTRMRTSYPAPIFATAADLGLADDQARTIITHVLAAWATEYSWFTYDTVPDLRHPTPGSIGVALPSEYDTGSGAVDGVVRSNIVALRQPPDRPQSMYDILTDLLSPFPGAVFYMNAAGQLVIVPAYGPDADENPRKTLGQDDVTSVSLGEPNIGTVINRATVSSQGYQRSDDVEVMQPAWFQVGSNARLGTSTWYTPPSDRVNLQATADDTILQESLASGQFGQQRPGVWPVSEDRIPAGEAISLVDSLDAPLITLAWTMFNTSGGIVDSGTDGLTLIRNDVPFDGIWRDTFRWDGPSTAFETDAHLVMRARWNAAAGGIELGFGAAKFETSCGLPVGCRTYVVEFTLNDASVGYAETTGTTVTYGTLDDDEAPIPSLSGGNAVAESQAAFGVQEVRVDVRGYVLDAVQALALAQGIVLANITPRAIRELSLTWRGSTVPLFDDRGRMIGTPGGGRGLLVGLQYQDDFPAGAASKRVRVEETIPGTDGYVPGTPGFTPDDPDDPTPTWPVYLLNADGSFWTNDDGTISPVP